MNNFLINNYTYTRFFDHYFTAEDDWLRKPEQPLLDYVKSLLPSYVDTVIIFGCASGRDFIPFQDTYNCIGFDLAPVNKIDWVCVTKNLTYYQCSLEDYLNKFDHNGLDLSRCLVYTQGTLMYVSYEDQTRFIKHLINHNCKNIVFHEYPPECTFSPGENRANPFSNFNPSLETIQLFERKHFRPTIERQPTGYLYLNK